ncbi:tetratricopeptide repeat protein [Tsuneonella mangrovi]|uniref:tetratricopeptide repeat protein n=1 Tax=Tsuneonella mangrovi TaxID=1982042 RepID=UPI000BA28B29|nr:tetratricopeptide repeat protein [Tsuneonella mangrovi]
MLPLLIPFMLQVGIGAPAAPDPVQQLDMRHRPPPRTAETVVKGQNTALEVCLDLAQSDPAKARDIATKWVARTTGDQQAMGNHCLGVATANLGQWDAARAAFLAARSTVSDPEFRARMGALAGSVALAANEPSQALADLDAALADKPATAELRGAIELDRATALVALGKQAEAAAALANARGETPASPEAWLLSATLSRRMNRLSEAQAQIEKAASLDPSDPAIGLEAGVIAVLSGHDDAARRSWKSVIASAPDSSQAKTAKGYIAQLDAGAR